MRLNDLSIVTEQITRQRRIDRCSGDPQIPRKRINTCANFARGETKNHRIFRTFSTGERRRLEDMSRCLIHGPRLKVVFSRAASRSVAAYTALYGHDQLSNWCDSSMDDGSRETGIDLESRDDILTHDLDPTRSRSTGEFSNFSLVVHLSSSGCVRGGGGKKSWEILVFLFYIFYSNQTSMTPPFEMDSLLWE